MIIGITGGIGSGKSTIAKALSQRGYTVYDCDREAKRIIAENEEVQQKIIALLGEEAFTNPSAPSLEERAGGEVSPIYNTTYVAKRVFADPHLLKELNAIVHPAVKADILSSFTSHLSPLFLESAILYESGLDILCDRVIVIDAPEEIRIARTIARDYHGDASPANIEKVRARIHAQTIPTGDLTILNDGKVNISELVDKITQFMCKN